MLGYDPFRKSLSSFFQFSSLEETIEKSDIVSINMSYNKEQNYHFFNRELFKKMKNGSILINTARGELIETEALIEAVEEGLIFGAGLDVLEDEQSIFFKKNDSSDLSFVQKRLIDLYPRIIITPHISSSTDRAVYEAMMISLRNLKDLKEEVECQNRLV